MMRVRTIGIALLLGAVAAAETAPQIAWVGDLDEALKQAKAQNKPLMVCINSKDGEKANEHTATKIYRDPEFVELSRKFVMVVVSTRGHAMEGACPRFGGVTCEEHLNCWKRLKALYGTQFLTANNKTEMISPQHAWFRPDGTLLLRKEYWLQKPQLLERMKTMLAEAANAAPPAADTADEGGAPAGDLRDAPLNSKELAELERAKSADDPSILRAALANVLASEKVAAHQALVDLLMDAKKEFKREILRVLGKAQVVDARVAIEASLNDRDPLVRSFAAVALEDLAQAASVPALLKRVKRERDTDARRNMYRALGACGGGAGDKDAAKQLLKGITGDKQQAVRKHAALACRHFVGDAAAVLLKKLERTALKVKDDTVRGGVVYALALIGDKETTAAVFRKILDKAHSDYRKKFLHQALNTLTGEGQGFDGQTGRWLFWEDRRDPARNED